MVGVGYTFEQFTMARVGLDVRDERRRGRKGEGKSGPDGQF